MKHISTFDTSLLQGKSILIVDDDPRNIFALVSYLEIMGLTVQTAESAVQAMEFLDHGPPIDIILLDMMMPEMDGYEALRLMRSRREWEKLPIVAVTAQAMKGDREKCLDAGATEYVSKPINMNELMEKMAKAMNIKA